MTACDAVTLFASVIFGIAVFGETPSPDDGRLASAIIGWLSRWSAFAVLAGAQTAAHERARTAARPRLGRLVAGV
jgi:hypothetical protein